MDALSMNSLRIVLVGATAIAAVVAALYGMWTVAAVLSVGVFAHGLLWAYLYQQRTRELSALHQGVDDLLRQEP